MANADGRVRAGQSIATAFSARAWNRAQDAADILLNARPAMAAEASGLERAPNFVMIKNDTGENLKRFGVLGISGVVINPSGGTLEGTNAASSAAREFSMSPVLSGVTPTVGHANKFAVLLEPCPIDGVVRAAVSGVFACVVNVIDSSHGFATIKVGDNEQLQSTGCGLVQLLWVESGIGSRKWAVGVM